MATMDIMQWIQQQMQAPMNEAQYDSFGNLTQVAGPKTDPWTGEAMSAPSLEQVLYGGAAGAGTNTINGMKDVLKQVSTAAGMPDFDWTPHLAEFARSSPGGYNLFGTSWGDSLSKVIGLAGATNPQIAQVAEQNAQQIKQMGDQVQGGLYSYQKSIEGNKLTDTLTDIGQFAHNPLSFAGEDTFLGKLDSIAADIPGSPSAIDSAVELGDWSNPFSAEKNSWDVIGGGDEASNDPIVRDVGRLFGGMMLGGAAMSGLDSLTSGLTANSTLGAIPAPTSAIEEMAMLGGGGAPTAPTSFPSLSQTVAQAPMQVAQAPTSTMTDVSAGLNTPAPQMPPAQPYVPPPVQAPTNPIPNIPGVNVSGTPGNLTGTLPSAPTSTNLIDQLTGQISGMGNLPQADLAQLIESGQQGVAGAANEALAGVGAGGGLSGVGAAASTLPGVSTATNAIAGTPVGQALQAAGILPGETGGVPTGGTNNQQQNPYQVPWGDIFSQLYGIWTSNQHANNSQDLLNTLINSDQWRGQQPKYFQPVYDAATKGIGDTEYGRSIADATSRQSAAKGYNMSGNMLNDIAKSLHGGTMDYLKTVGPLAMGRGETQAGTPSLTNNILGGQAGTMAGGGSIIESLFKGQQPTQAQQANKVPTNQNLMQLLGGLI